MGLKQYKLGDLIERLYNKNSRGEYGVDDVRGVSNLKAMMKTKADLTGRDLTKFSVVYPNEFVFNHRTSRNGSRFSITQNYDDVPHIFTEDYVVFRVRKDSESILDHNWLYLYFNRDEFDRFVITNSWGSSTEFYNWEDLCDIDIKLPDLSIQQKFVNVYRAMIENQKAYENGLSELKLTCDAYIEDAKRSNANNPESNYRLGELIRQRREKYDGSVIPIRGVSREGFITPKQGDADLHSYNLYYLNDFVFNPARMEINSIALNIKIEKACCSSLYEVFYVERNDIVLPEYLNLLLKRNEFARWCEYVGWGSAREYCRVDAISTYHITIPSINEQQAIVDIYRCYLKRKEINERLKVQIKNLCPILIRGSIEEAQKEA